ncbi:MAG: hypothetical protein KBT47_04320, partial [Armatimonadetes bacterium]|nr:hypothetical protein [Candidatus Hippobium faecium]
NVQGNIKEDRGMDDKDTLARLSWLNTYIGDEDIPLPPYTPVEVKDNKISILDRDITLGEDGLPLSITSRGNEILASPITFDIITEEKSETSSSQLLQENQGLTFADFVSKTDNPFFEITTKTKTECEGCITFSVTLKAKKHIETEDISLSIPVRKEIAEYMIGFGRQGGFRKGNIKWKWNKSRCDYRFWTGNTEAGIHLDLRHSHDTWDQYFNYHFGNPPSWDNEGLGGAEVTERENDVLIKAFSGARTFEENEICEFNFRLHITPFHRQIENHWDYSYTYSGKQTSAHYAHQHHADPCYPYINYPFFFMDRMKTKFEEYRKHFKGVNLYYTCREMSVHAPELWAFESLNYEIYEDGKELENTQKEIFLTLFGGKCAWLKEHLSIDCHPEWRSVLEQDEFDPAIGTLPVSRLSNFYIKGLDYILDKVPFDGVYIDTVKYSRSTMRRLAQVLYKKLGYARINLHTYNMYNHFDTRTSPIVQYMEHLPYMT